MTIEDLQAQRAEINRQIRELRRQGDVEASGARIVRKTSYTGGTKRECIDAIPGIIGVLRGLYEKATKGESE